MTKIKYTRAVKLYLDKQAKGLKDSEIYEIIVEKYGNSLANRIFATPKKTLEEHAILDPKRNPRGYEYRIIGLSEPYKTSSVDHIFVAKNLKDAKKAFYKRYPQYKIESVEIMKLANFSIEKFNEHVKKVLALKGIKINMSNPITRVLYEDYSINAGRWLTVKEFEDELILRQKQKRNPRSGFRKFFEIKDRSGTVYSTVGGMKLAKSHAQRFANMYDKQMIIHPVKLLR